MATIPKIQQVIAILWPGFLVSGVATVVVFTVIDPVQVSACMGGPQVSYTAAYSMGFFLFWLMTSLSSLLTCYFQRPCETMGSSVKPG
jgi:hypothetical protein